MSQNLNEPPSESLLGDAVHTEAGAVRVLVAATFLFAVCFAVWVMFSIIGIPMRHELGMTRMQFAILVAIPVLTGALMRVPVGVLADKIGGRATLQIILLVTAGPVFLVSHVNSYGMALVLALGVGLAGSAFAAGIAWVSAWYPPEHKAFALGVFGMGNIGASLTQLIAPALITLVPASGLAGGLIGGEWRFVPALYAGLLVVCAVLVRLVVPGPDRKPAGSRTLMDLTRPLKHLRVWRFGFYYMTVFGAFVGVSLWLPKYYVDNYDIELRTAGFLAALFVIAASLIRPVGGAFSDKFGGRNVMLISLGTSATMSLLLTFPMGLHLFAGIVVVLGLGLGIGTAAVYAYIPQYFPEDVGAVGGLVGAIGAIGGFILPLTFALVINISHRPQAVYIVLLALAFYSAMFLAFAISGMRPPTDPLHDK